MHALTNAAPRVTASRCARAVSWASFARACKRAEEDPRYGKHVGNLFGAHIIFSNRSLKTLCVKMRENRGRRAERQTRETQTTQSASGAVEQLVSVLTVYCTGTGTTACRARILFTLVDDWGYELWPRAQSPHEALLSRLRQTFVDEGMTLERHYILLLCALAPVALSGIQH